MTHRNSLGTYRIASIFDTRLMRSYTCTYKVTGVIQLTLVTDVDHASMPYAPQTSAQLPPHCAIVIVKRLAPFVVCNNERHKREPTHCDGEAWLPPRGAEGPGFTLHLSEDGDEIGMPKCARRRRPAERRRGGTRRSRTRRRRSDDSAKSSNRHRGELKRVTRQRTDSPRQRIDIFFGGLFGIFASQGVRFSVFFSIFIFSMS